MMKKTILGISFLIMAAFAGNASAQSNDQTACSSKEGCKTEQCDKKDCKKPDCKSKSDRKKCDQSRECTKACPFEGLNLSEEQKVKIQDLDKAMKTSREEMRTRLKEKNDSEKINPRENEKSLRAKYLDDLQKILSGDQYMQFLQNFYVNQMLQHPNRMKAGINKMERRIDKAAKSGKADIQKSEKRIVKDTKKIEKKVEKEATKVEKKVEKK